VTSLENARETQMVLKKDQRFFYGTRKSRFLKTNPIKLPEKVTGEPSKIGVRLNSLCQTS
jgi:hypothetical protein